MLNKPKIKRCFHVETVEPEGVFLLSENHSYLLNGRLYQQLVPLINGQHTVDDIAALMQGQASAPEVYYALMLMEQKGYLIEDDDELPTTIAAFCEMLNVETTEAKSRLQTTQVAVSAVGAITLEPFIAKLKSFNIQVAAEGEIEIILTDDYLQEGLETINQKALHSQRPWMLVKPVGTMLWIGPLFRPGKTGCWECLAQRLRANRPVELFVQRRKGISTPFPTSIAGLPFTLEAGFDLAATEMVKWIIQGNPEKREGTLVTLDTLSLETQHHILTQRPQCPCCGRPQAPTAKPLPMGLESRRKIFTADGGHRSVSPEETLKKHEHHISPITGVVRALMPVAPTGNGLTPIYIAGHNFATMFDELYFLRENVRGRSAGKGKTAIQSKASGFCEAIERYSGVFQGDEIRQTGRYQTLGDAAIHPNVCMNFSEAQYQTRHEWNARCAFFQKVPEPFDEEREIEWTPLWSLTHNTFKYLPTAYCYYAYPKPPKPDCWANSNGSAAGNSKEEAILQGFMEIVERDSVAVWWYNRIKRPAVDLDRFDDPYFQAIKAYYHTLHRELWVLDISSDFNIPVFAAISSRTDKAIEDIIFGFGAHFDPKIALLRAITEVHQSLPAVSSVAADGTTQYPPDDQEASDWWKTATLDNQPYLVPDEQAVAKVSSDYPQQWSEDLRDDVINCIELAEKQGLEVLVLDQTRPDITLNVVKVVIPGMRHFWKRFGPGRLYDVPVKMGWLPAPLTENQLNPIPIFV